MGPAFRARQRRSRGGTATQSRCCFPEHGRTSMPRPLPSDINVPLADDDLGVQAFLDAMGEALTTGNTNALADLWELPAYILGVDAAEALEERGELLAVFSGARE